MSIGTTIQRYPARFAFQQMFGIIPRISIHSLALINVFFLAFYNKVVCPFIDGLPYFSEFNILLVATVVQIVLKEALYLYYPPNERVSPPRHAYKLNVYSWIFSGLVATWIHLYLFADTYPWHSALKVVSGFWIFGGGLLAQLEYVILEQAYRKVQHVSNTARSFLERLARRVIESSLIFILAPSSAMLIMVIRYAIQESIIPVGVVLEIAFLGVSMVIFAVLIAHLYTRNLKRDTNNIVHALDEVRGGNFSTDVTNLRNDELGQVAISINEMVQGLKLREKIKDAFGRFVNPRIAEEFIKNYSEEGKLKVRGKKQRVVILMCDIRGFTKMSEKMDAEHIANMLNEYFTLMVAVVQRHQGIVDKFIGDAIMALFGITGEQDSCDRAVAAAIDMRKALREFNQKRTKQGFPPIDNGIGIEFGDVIAGYLGSETRLEFTVVGSPVNQASRYCDVARTPHPSIIIGQEVKNNISASYAVQSLGTTELKGLSDTNIFGIADLERDNSKQDNSAVRN